VGFKRDTGGKEDIVNKGVSGWKKNILKGWMTKSVRLGDKSCRETEKDEIERYKGSNIVQLLNVKYFIF
jgi:hypothetical protein